MKTENATYSFEDNKIRISSLDRFSNDEIQKLKNAGYKWAPMQKIWVAPCWTYSREQLAIELCEEIEIEEMTLEERQELRASLFEQYSQANSSKAAESYSTSSKIISNIPIGQPVLIGHHSQKRHESALARVDNLMRKSCEFDKKANYFRQKAESSRFFAQMKSNPGVTARRIKKLEKELRDSESNLKKSLYMLEHFEQRVFTNDDLYKIGKTNQFGFYLQVKESETHLETWFRPTLYSYFHEREENTEVKKYEERTFEEMKSHFIEVFKNQSIKQERVVEHLKSRIDFENAKLQKCGTLSSQNEISVKIGDTVVKNRKPLKVVKVNRKSGKITSIIAESDYNYKCRLLLAEIESVISA